MSEERLDRLESLMQDLIKMVAVNNTMTKELKSDVAVLKDDIAVLKSDVAQLKTESAMLKKNQELFRDELFARSARMDDLRREVRDKIAEKALNTNYAVSMSSSIIRKFSP
ncbi:hypothetical protein P378_12565 [Desulforamulus profundi]|uniref:Uncharacterized protein n=1 Tax=Desulforamulus profundi TaxID=1383067 RepID=A0A2C6ME84_9FIRM|nr:hypothetical protein [Desulforamulus profundi]MCL5781421.1 hypothetical protein [Bacillota bacterium]PHJ37932.1 hypothetical protein P378_12565 [Desulforamulus profundi]